MELLTIQNSRSTPTEESFQMLTRIEEKILENQTELERKQISSLLAIVQKAFPKFLPRRSRVWRLKRAIVWVDLALAEKELFEVTFNVIGGDRGEIHVNDDDVLLQVLLASLK
ncbi:hypothetical protein VNO77_22529 [Canavalia gladiata]|uniref:Uncharacterized protein n=1 Tax=Canavalia gladiata TaxID=3824 RepID=A0AAN9L608_CANGL